MAERVIRLGTGTELERRQALVDAVDSVAPHLVGSEVTDLFAAHGLPLQQFGEPQGDLTAGDPADYTSPHAVVISSARRARQINAYYSQLGEGLLEYVGPIVALEGSAKPVLDGQPTNGGQMSGLAAEASAAHVSGGAPRRGTRVSATARPQPK